MRRWMIACIGCMIVLLISCGKEDVTPITNDFSCRVELLYNGQEASAVLERSADNVTMLTFDSPAALENVIMQWDGNNVTLHYNGMELKVENDRVPVGAAAKVICETLEACQNAALPLQNGCAQGKADFGEYTFEFDTNSGYPLTLTCPTLGLSARFYDCMNV